MAEEYSYDEYYDGSGSGKYESGSGEYESYDYSEGYSEGKSGLEQSVEREVGEHKEHKEFDNGEKVVEQKEMEELKLDDDINQMMENELNQTLGDLPPTSDFITDQVKKYVLV